MKKFLTLAIFALASAGLVSCANGQMNKKNNSKSQNCDKCDKCSKNGKNR
jgi:hypothetical protein